MTSRVVSTCQVGRTEVQSRESQSGLNEDVDIGPIIPAVSGVSDLTGTSDANASLACKDIVLSERSM